MNPIAGRCGFPLQMDYGADFECASCIAEPPVFDNARAVFQWNDASAKLGFRPKVLRSCGFSARVI